MDKMRLKMLYSDLKSDLEVIENELAAAVNSSSHLLNEASLHLLLAGEKESALYLYCFQLNLATIL